MKRSTEHGKGSGASKKKRVIEDCLDEMLRPPPLPDYRLLSSVCCYATEKNKSGDDVALGNGSFGTFVASYLRLGWRLHGSPTVSLGPDNSLVEFQAVAK